MKMDVKKFMEAIVKSENDKQLSRLAKMCAEHMTMSEIIKAKTIFHELAKEKIAAGDSNFEYFAKAAWTMGQAKIHKVHEVCDMAKMFGWATTADANDVERQNEAHRELMRQQEIINQQNLLRQQEIINQQNLLFQQQQNNFQQMQFAQMNNQF